MSKGTQVPPEKQKIKQIILEDLILHSVTILTHKDWNQSHLPII